MSYCFFSSLLVRTPLFSYHNYSSADCSQILQNDLFKTALFLASSSFYDELEKKHFQFELLDDKQKQSVRKYHNRASFRSTPFGLFSSFSLVNWTDQQQAKPELSPEPLSLIQPDFSVLAKAWENHIKLENLEQQKFQPNQTLYLSKTDFRYIRTETTNEGQTHFSMVTIAKNAVLKKLLKFCEKTKCYSEIHNFLFKETGSEDEAIHDYIRDLIDQQIIISSYAPNITGRDYSVRILEYLKDDGPYTAAFRNLFKGWSVNAPGTIPQLKAVMKDFSGIGNDKNIFYAVSKRDTLNGGLSSKHQQQILEGIHCLNVMSNAYQVEELQKLKEAFSAKYGSAEIPLLEVLDAQLGVGYGDFANIKSAYSFFNSNQDPQKRSSLVQKDGREDMASLFLNLWHHNKPGHEKPEIEITDKHLHALDGDNRSGNLPPGISVLFRICGKDLFIEDAGGTSSLSMIGRFSCEPGVHQLGEEIAAQEQAMNPDIIFAEIAHICNHHSANINRREHLRDYEIPLLTHSLMKTERQISLSDIMVSVAEDTVMLYSKRLGKRIIPRLSSAYNYTNNCFPIFRFLCDVQRQHLKSQLSFSLPALMPGLKFYPRVRYKSCILQMAEWHFDSSEFNHIHQASAEEKLVLLRKLAGKKGLPNIFALTHHDNFLVFNLEKNDDALFFLKEIRNNERIVLREFPFTGSQHEPENSNAPFLEQYLASLYLDAAVYKKMDVSIQVEKSRKKTTTEHWLYFKIYCHPLSANTILCEFLFPLVKKCIKEGITSEWFFIRYQDPEYHIRLRVKAAPHHHGTLFAIFSQCLIRLTSDKLVHRFQTDIYQPEYERYSAELMEQVEHLFMTSSDLVSSFLKNNHYRQAEEELWLIEAITSVHRMLGYFELDPDQRIQFCNVQFGQFFKEFGSPKNLKSELEKFHKAHHIAIALSLKAKVTGTTYKKLEQGIERVLQDHRLQKIINPAPEKLAADLIHMHINRLFSYDQRYFEMVVYFLLYRSLSALKHKANV